MSDGPWRRLDRLVLLAETLAGAWGPRARASTTPGRERAILRLFGVHDLDRDGRPLSGEVVERYLRSSPDRLAGGIALPFAMGLLEYDLGPQELALDVAADAIDLGLEAELLTEPDRRGTAEAEATRLGMAAFERIDANRVALRELTDLLGDPPRPWVAGGLDEPTTEEARDAAANLVRAGADLVRVAVPRGRELANRLQDAGLDAGPWWPREPRGARDEEGWPDELAPAGSQRGLALLRSQLDELAAERRGYARLATLAPPFGAPEQAVVAAFERVDVVWSDPVTEIVIGGVDPDRALADHAFAHEIHRRSGTLVVFDAGPLVVAPDLALGVPPSAATRAGRALALQLLAVTLAKGDRLPTESLCIGALPGWVVEERDPAAQAIAQVALRQALFTGHPFAFEEPSIHGPPASAWPFVVAASLADPGNAAIVYRRARDARFAGQAAAIRAGLRVAAESAASFEPRAVIGAARAHGEAMVEEAIVTLERLRDEGWQSILGEVLAVSDSDRLGAKAVLERTETFDPFGSPDSWPPPGP
jgi:hypothetical protein